MAWTPKEATYAIRAIAQSNRLALTYKLHATERLAERGLINSDVLYALKNGFVHQPPEPAKRAGYDRYRMESKTPNGGARSIGIVVIPDEAEGVLQIVTVMWLDEFETRAGSIIGE